MTLIARPSPNFDARTRPVELIVLHYTGMQSLEIALDRLTDPAPVAGRYPGPWQPADTPADQPLGRVSAHYVVAEDGRVFSLVDEANRAWHAGASHWAGEGDVNSRSIGIEIANGGHDFGLPPFPNAQIEAVIGLVGDISVRHKLGPHRVVGHSDIAPARKADPGEHFPWERLSAAGLALGPLRLASPNHAVLAREGAEGAGVLAAQEHFAAIGYACAQNGLFDSHMTAIVTAFQRRFRASKVDGVLDQETADRLADIADQSVRLSISRLRS
jgi:N-acetylmuramoyl-L-alanine amidase